MKYCLNIKFKTVESCANCQYFQETEITHYTHRCIEFDFNIDTPDVGICSQYRSKNSSMRRVPDLQDVCSCANCIQDCNIVTLLNYVQRHQTICEHYLAEGVRK